MSSTAFPLYSNTTDMSGLSNVQNPKTSNSIFSESITKPPVNFLKGNGGGDDSDGDMKVRKRFKKAELFDKASLEKKDRAAVIQRVSNLKKELLEYQYNLGILLIEKKEWTSHEKSSNMIPIFEVERREENLRNALGIQKQCVVNLEKALGEMRAECAETKYNADLKMTEAHGLVASLEEMSLKVEAKFHAADAKLVEANRKSSEIERKLKEVECRENILRIERQSSIAEREMNEAAIAKKREEMGKWERKLQERDDGLLDGRRVLHEREDRASEIDRSLKQKHKDINEIIQVIEKESSRLKQKEEDSDTRLAELVCKEKETDTCKEQLEIKNKELLSLEELLLKEREGLKQDKVNFEREWELLGEKRAESIQEIKQLMEETERLKQLKQAEEEQLKTVKRETHEYIKREFELFRRQKESFEADMEHERSVICPKACIERGDMLRHFEVTKRKFEIDMQKQREEMEKELRDKEKAFEDQKERDLNHVNHLREVAEKELEDIKLEWARMEKEKEKIATDKQHLEDQQHDMQKDIEDLDNLIKGLKDKREQFLL